MSLDREYLIMVRSGSLAFFVAKFGESITRFQVRYNVAIMSTETLRKPQSANSVSKHKRGDIREQVQAVQRVCQFGMFD